MKLTKLKKFIGKYEKFIICAHESPDGDAIGSEYAFLLGLRKLGKKVIVLNNDPTPSNFIFVDATNDIGYYQDKTDLPQDLEEYALFILDTNDTHNIGQIFQVVLPYVKETFIIDHHDSEERSNWNSLINPNASSTAEIIYQIFKGLKIEIDLPIAKALYMAIVYDTGSFIYPKTSSLTFKIAHHLVTLGVNPNEIYTQVYETDSIPSIILQSKVLSTLELEMNNHVAIQTMLKDMLDQTGALYEESRAIINIPLKANEVKVSIFIKEDHAGVTRCSLRSKGDIDVCKIAQQFGGGGHKNASGFKFDIDIKDVRKKILDQLKKYF